jgi:hypothetical protein
MSLSNPARESYHRKERASKEMQEQEGVTRKLPRSGLVQQLFNRNFFLDKSLWTTIFPDKMLS